MPYDKIIQGGKLVTPAGVVEADLAITGEKIAAIGMNLADSDSRVKVIDAKNHLVLPGVIDVHVHLDLPVCGTVSSDDFRTGTRAAARGGVTTVIDFATPYKTKTGSYESLEKSVDNWFRKAEGKSLIDYSFHICITHWETHKHQIQRMIGKGFPTFKEFMIYESEGWQSDDGALFSSLEKMKQWGGLLMVHAESDRVLKELIDRHHTPALMKKYGAKLHSMTRPNFIEAEAVQRAIHWSRVTGGPLYIVHLSTGEGADLVRNAQRKGVPVFCETCPQYLVLDDSVFAGKEGHLFATSPQVKKIKDNVRLWQGLQEGEISVISTDTCSFTRVQKARWKGDFTRIPGGMPGLETLLPLIYTHGVLKNRLTLEQMCQKLSTAPAKLMGLFPRKGMIQVGSDADLTIIHPRKKIEVDPRKMETNTDWSPFEGWKLAGFARTTLSRGEIIVDDYQVVGQEGRGVWLPRKLPNPIPGC